MNRYIIIGGVAAGATAAARLRRLDETAEIILLERGPYVSYANCGLPYHIGGEIANRQALFVATAESIAAKYKIDVRVGHEAIAVDPERKVVTIRRVADGETMEEPYTKLLLATGSSPILPPFPGLDGERVFSLWTVPDTDKIKAYVDEAKPKRAVVVGGGFIGLEMVENLKERGLEVDLVEKMPQVMAPLDPDMAQLLENHLAEKGVRLHLGKGLVSIHEGGRRVLLDDNSEINTDMVLLSIGVRPNNELPKALGLELNGRGYVVTDSGMRTSVADIYAAGDMVEVRDWLTGEMKSVPLAGPANKQGRIAADNMAADANAAKIPGYKPNWSKSATKAPAAPQGQGARYHYKGTQGTSIARIFDLAAASTGQNEKQLQAKGMVYGQDYSFSLVHPQSHAGYFPGALPLTIKLIFSLNDGLVLGAQIVGYDGVAKRIDTIATAMHFRASIYDLLQLELAYAPPFSSAKDPVNMAAYAATNILEGLTDVTTWPLALHEVEAEKRSLLLDVRERPELTTGTIPGALCIPLTELRVRLNELDKDNHYYIFCAVGLRGYLAERILKQNDFNCTNILGGMRSYKSFKGQATLATAKDLGDLPRDGGTAAAKAGASTSPLNKAATNAASVTATAAATSEAPAATPAPEADSANAAATGNGNVVTLDACGLSCPGPIVEVARAMSELTPGDQLEVRATDPGFVRDIDAWCENTGNRLLEKGSFKGGWFARLERCSKNQSAAVSGPACSGGVKEKTMIIFDGDLDKAIASFIIANGAAAMGNKVNMFFTFWGLNILRRPEKVKVKKDFMSRMFGFMMPRGSKKLSLSKMNFGGAGAKMIRGIMKKKNISSLEDLIAQAKAAGVKMIACQMSMDVMGITKEELIDGVEVGGVASMLADNDRSNMNLFI